MQRLRLYDCRMSRLPTVIGKCSDDIASISDMVNSAQRRLLMCKEACDEGWWGTWAEIVFNVSRSQPYITLPREIARLEWINVCDEPVNLENQFYEYLNFGNGRLPKSSVCSNAPSITTGLTRNNAVTFIEMENAPQFITAYLTDDRDIGKRVLIQGIDTNSTIITSTTTIGQVQGQFLNLTSPAPMTTVPLLQLTGIQKDRTYGIIRIYQHDPTTGEEVLLLTMQPSETTAMYRRYYLNGLPQNCCGTSESSDVQVTAIAKLDLIPVAVDTDYLLIQNLEAIIEECASIRYSEMDSPTAKGMSNERHLKAIGFLNGELNHYIGKDSVAVGFNPFGSAHLKRQKIGRLW